MGLIVGMLEASVMVKIHRIGLCGLLAAVAVSQVQGQTSPPILPPPVRVLVPGNPIPPEQPRTLTGSGDSPSIPVLPPVFHDPNQMDRINAAVNRAMALGNVTPNYQRIADTLEKGFPNILGWDSLGQLVKKNAAEPNIRFAGGDEVVGQAQQVPNGKPDPKPNGPNGQQPPPQEDNGLKQTIDEINKIFKTQADLIRSIDIGGTRRPDGPAANMVPAAIPPGVDPPRVVLGGRTGLELSPVHVEVLDHFKIPRDQGLVIREVFPDTPAEAAGFKKGDILLEFNNRRVPSNLPDFIERVMSTVRNNTPIPAVVLRGNERVKVADMKITDRRVIPPLVNERQPDMSSIIRVVPGINSDQQNTNSVPELRIIRNGLITEVVPFYPNKK